jgi:hypothetical protein
LLCESPAVVFEKRRKRNREEEKEDEEAVGRGHTCIHTKKIKMEFKSEETRVGSN